MEWNHRLLATKDGSDIYFQVHEVYYTDEKDPFKPTLHTENGKAAGGNSVEEVEKALERMKECLSKPILWGDDRFPEEYKL